MFTILLRFTHHNFSQEITHTYTHTYASLFEFNDLQSSINRHYFTNSLVLSTKHVQIKKESFMPFSQIVRKLVKDIAKKDKQFVIYLFL